MWKFHAQLSAAKFIPFKRLCQFRKYFAIPNWKKKPKIYAGSGKILTFSGKENGKDKGRGRKME
jgi:hypothetical protein